MNDRYFGSNPSDVLKNINNTAELQYLALALSENKYYQQLAELPLLVTTDSFNNLIDYYGGKELYIPTKYDIYSNTLGLMSYYYYDIKGLTWNETIRELGIPRTTKDKKMLTNRYNKVVANISDYKIPEIPNSMSVSHKPVNKNCKANKLVRLGSRLVSKEVYDSVINSMLTELRDNFVVSPETIKKIRDFYNGR